MLDLQKSRPLGGTTIPTLSPPLKSRVHCSRPCPKRDAVPRTVLTSWGLDAAPEDGAVKMGSSRKAYPPGPDPAPRVTDQPRGSPLRPPAL
jgi:hypothetical protein